MGNITQLSQGNLDGLKKQVCECIDHAQAQGYKEGKKEPREVKVVNVEDTNEYQIGYKVGREDGYNKGIADSKDALFTEEEVNDIANKERQYGYNQGLEDASNLIAYGDSKFVKACYPSDADYSLYDLNAKYGLADIVEKFKAYEKEIKIGDEVKDLASDNIGVVMAIGNLVVYITDNGVYTNKLGSLEKTGRHFDEVGQLLDKLKGDKE